MSVTSIRDLLIDLDSISPAFETKPLTQQQIKQLKRISSATHSHADTLTNGVSAIGWAIASAASSTDHGLSSDELMSLGWLLHELGKLATALHEMSSNANFRLKQAEITANPEG